MPPQTAAAAWPSLRSLGTGSAGSWAGARHGVVRGGTCVASGGGGLAVAALARRGLRRLLRWRASRCGARWHMCCLRRRRLGRCCARSARAAPASTLVRVTVLRRVAAAWPFLHALDSGCAGFYAGARLSLVQGGTCAASGGGGLVVAKLAQRGMRRLLRWRASRCCARRHMCCLRRSRLGRCCARSTRAAPASTLARVTVWREAAHVLPQPAAAWPSLRLLDAGCAGSWAGARHGVARGGTCAASGGGGLAVAALARRGLRRLLRWRASRCGARWHVCRLRRRRLGRCCARSTRAAPASTLARVTVWRGVARVQPQAAAAAWPSLHSLGPGSAGSWAGARHGVARGGTCAASGGSGLAVAALAWRGLCRLLRWHASRCGARWHMCCLRRRRLGRRCARSTRVALARTLACVTVWREAARSPPQDHRIGVRCTNGGSGTGQDHAARPLQRVARCPRLRARRPGAVRRDHYSSLSGIGAALLGPNRPP
jgi:hypothetical protein